MPCPIMRKSYKEGTFSLLKNSIVIIVCTLAIVLLKLSAAAVVLGAVVLGALFFPPKAEPPIQNGEEK